MTYISDLPLRTQVKTYGMIWTVIRHSPTGTSIVGPNGEKMHIPPKQSLHVVRAAPTWMP